RDRVNPRFSTPWPPSSSRPSRCASMKPHNRGSVASRDALSSYIRGAWRRREDAETGGIASTFLRGKATYTVVGLTYDDAAGTTYTLVGLFYLRAGDTANAQVQKFYGTVPTDIDVRGFEQYLKVGVDKRKIKSAFPEARFSDQYRVF